MELSAHVWKSGTACAHEEDDRKQTKMTDLFVGPDQAQWGRTQ